MDAVAQLAVDDTLLLLIKSFLFKEGVLVHSGVGRQTETSVNVYEIERHQSISLLLCGFVQ